MTERLAAAEERADALRKELEAVERACARLPDPPEPLTAGELAAGALPDRSRPRAAGVPAPPADSAPGTIAAARADLAAGRRSAVDLVEEALERARAGRHLGAFPEAPGRRGARGGAAADRVAGRVGAGGRRAAPPRDPPQRQGHRGRRRDDHHLGVEVPARGGPERSGLGAARRRRGHPARQEQPAGVRLRRQRRQPELREDPEPARSGAHPGRVVVRFRGGGGHRHGLRLGGDRYRGVHPHPGVAQRGLRPETVLWRGPPGPA